MSKRHGFATFAAAAELTCWICGVGLCSAYALASGDRQYHRARDVASFEAQTPDQTLWSRSRINEYRSAPAPDTGEVIGVLRIPGLHLEVPVYPRVTTINLNRGAALIDGMTPPDHGGNSGIAGHRDGFFRVLKDIRTGDAIELQTRRKVHRYRVSAAYVVKANDVAPLADTAEPTLTLITCYPFYYVGNAPERFIVRATYDWSDSVPD